MAGEQVELTITPEDQQRASATVREQQLQYAESMAVRYLAQLGALEREVMRLQLDAERKDLEAGRALEDERAVRATKEAVWINSTAEQERTIARLHGELRQAQDVADDLTERLGHMEGERDAARAEIGRLDRPNSGTGG